MKLSFLKNIREEDAPEFIDLPLMEALANEDRWMEFQDIPLGHWANFNLRKIAEEADVKDVYDRYYDWSSSYTHGPVGRRPRRSAYHVCEPTTSFPQNTELYERQHAIDHPRRVQNIEPHAGRVEQALPNLQTSNQMA